MQRPDASMSAPSAADGDVEMDWKHDKYQDSSARSQRSTSGSGNAFYPANKDSPKLVIDNLHYEVSERELEVSSAPCYRYHPLTILTVSVRASGPNRSGALHSGTRPGPLSPISNENRSKMSLRLFPHPSPLSLLLPLTMLAPFLRNLAYCCAFGLLFCF